MPATLQHESGNLWRFHISGILTKSELDAAQESAKEAMAKVGKIRTLVVLEDFKGWEQGGAWGKMGFFYKHGDRIEKIAIVGDLKWESDALMFSGAGLRRAPVRYFPASELAQARTWIVSRQTA